MRRDATTLLTGEFYSAGSARQCSVQRPASPPQLDGGTGWRRRQSSRGRRARAFGERAAFGHARFGQSASQKSERVNAGRLSQHRRNFRKLAGPHSLCTRPSHQGLDGGARPRPLPSGAGALAATVRPEVRKRQIFGHADNTAAFVRRGRPVAVQRPRRSLGLPLCLDDAFRPGSGRRGPLESPFWRPQGLRR